MPFATVIFSADDVRGALLCKTLEKKGFEITLHKNIRAAGDIVRNKSPRLVIVDKVGYFPSELEYFGSLSELLSEVPVLVIANSSSDDSLMLKGVRVEWCVSNPLDLTVVVAKAKDLLMDKPTSDLKSLLPSVDESVPSEDETLAKDLMGFLGLK